MSAQEQDVDLDTELALLARVDRAYETARRLVFDVGASAGRSGTASLTDAQADALAQLAHARAALHSFRERRRELVRRELRGDRLP